MSWVQEKDYKWYEAFALNIMKVGPVPHHVAFIMDGNRRFAKNYSMNKSDGHEKGFEKLSECLKWCLDIGIKEFTAFAFSIENFKRDDDEVNALLDLARIKFKKLVAEKDKLKEKGVKVRVLGNINLLPRDLQQLVAKAMLLTENNNQLFLNIALAYTSNDEITSSIEAILGDFDDFHREDIEEYLLQHCLYTSESDSPGLLIRTSGESRISDFLMWQISTAVMYFPKVYWPEFSIWHFLYGIFCYQRAIPKMWSYKRQQELKRQKSKELLPKRVQEFLQRLEGRRREYLVNLASEKFKDD